MPNPKKEYKHRESLTSEEVQGMMDKADVLYIGNNYFRLRSKALVGILSRMGKRRSEIASVLRKDVEVKDDGLIYFTYTIRKKHKKGFFQYLNWLKENDPNYEDRPLVVLKQEWKEWTKTNKEGYSIKKETRTKRVPIKDKYMKPVLEYLDYLDSVCPETEYLFPSGIMVFGESYKFLPHKHLSGRQLLNLVQKLNDRCWMHLFRDFCAGEIARRRGDTLTSVVDVKRTLDLEQQSTAMIYVNRHAIQTLDYEEE
ncbi:MAG: hypothetical protein AC479_05980 [miscellaneous Crenarchaeota group-6 archaeon AD8-1]|nr:MAG: hypothetical protein AC479_05980 [miscellaneous Crenarchaeota group-6 archaeon AD8-1]